MDDDSKLAQARLQRLRRWETAIHKIMQIDPAEHATKSRDFGRGFAEALRQVKEVLAEEHGSAKDEARTRIESFLDGWAMMGDKTDLIYGVGVKNEDETRDLLASDLRLLLGIEAS